MAIRRSVGHPFAVLSDGAKCGLVLYGEEDEPDYRHPAIDIFLDPPVYGRGVGRDAVATLARHFVHDRGHHQLVIDPAAHNEPAIRCYTKVGSRPVGIMRRYERDADGVGWHDGLRMDLLVRNSTRLADIRKSWRWRLPRHPYRLGIPCGTVGRCLLEPSFSAGEVP